MEHKIQIPEEKLNELNNQLILKDKMSLRCIEISKEILQKEMVTRYKLIKLSDKKSELMKKKLELLEKQLSEFKQSRQLEINKIGIELCQIDAMASEDTQLKKISEEISTLKHEIVGLIKKVSNLDQIIPRKYDATVYNIKTEYK